MIPNSWVTVFVDKKDSLTWSPGWFKKALGDSRKVLPPHIFHNSIRNSSNFLWHPVVTQSERLWRMFSSKKKRWVTVALYFYIGSLFQTTHSMYLEEEISFGNPFRFHARWALGRYKWSHFTPVYALKINWDIWSYFTLLTISLHF